MLLEIHGGGWWDEGHFYRGLCERREDGHYGTGYKVDLTPANNLYSKFVDGAIAFANEHGLAAAVEKFPKLFIKLR